MLQRWAVIYALVVGESDKITKQSHSGFRPQRAIVLGPTPPLLLVSSVSAPYPSAGSNAKEYCRENIARYKAPSTWTLSRSTRRRRAARSRNTSCESPPPNDPVRRPSAARRGDYGLSTCRSSLGGNYAPGGEDAYVCDLSRGRGAYTSLHPERLVTYLF